MHLRIVLFGFLFAIASLNAYAGDDGQPATALPRRAGAANESYADVDVQYDSVVDGQGRSLRIIVTHPHAASRPLPTVFLAGWLSCVSVEATPGSKSALADLFSRIAQTPDLVFVRVDKAGVGDSQGDCASSDFSGELDGYRAAFRALERYAFVDQKRLFIVGLSNGGGFAPLVAEDVPVRGYVVEGAWADTWLEHMLQIERRRWTLSGKAPGEINTLMAREAPFYVDYLVRGQRPADLIAREPGFAALWDDSDYQHQYGRPVAFYQQLQKLNLAEAWAKVRAPALVLHGEYDWIMSRADHEAIVALVNKNVPGAAKFIEVPKMAHGFDTYTSMEESFKDAGGPLDPGVAKMIIEWVQGHAR